MLRMIGYELRKIFTKKNLCIVLPVFLFLGFATKIIDIANVGIGRSDMYYARKDFIEAYGGRLTEENYQLIMEEYAEAEEYYAECEGEEQNDKGRFAGTRLRDFYLLQDMAGEADYIKEYEEKQFALMAQAEENVRLYRERDNLYKVRENEQVCSLYSVKPALKIIRKDGWSELEEHSDIFFLLLIIALYVSAVFSEEQELNMFPILYTGAKGRKGIALAKIAASSIFACAMALIFAGVRYGIAFLRSGLSDFGEYIQNKSTYQYCPFNMTFGEMVLSSVLLIALGSVCFAVLVCLASAFCNKNIAALVAGVFLLIVVYGNVYRMLYLPSTIGIGTVDFSSDSFDFNERYMIAGLFEPQRFFWGYHPVNIFGYPVVSLAVNIALTAIKIILFATLTVLAYTKKKFYRHRLAVKGIAGFRRGKELGGKHDSV